MAGRPRGAEKRSPRVHRIMGTSHVVITGASAGIGEALARVFAASGAHLTLIARREDRLRALADELEVQTYVVGADLSRVDTATDWIEGAEAELGPIDVLINNAGMQPIGHTWSIDPDQAEKTIALNLTVPLKLTRTILPGMLDRGAGTIVNISSMAALAPTPGMTWYNATKAGLAAASESLGGELLKKPVNAITVYPGIIAETDMAQAGYEKYENTKAVALQPTGTAQGLAERVLEAVKKGRRRVIYPKANAVARHFPALTRWTLDRFTPDLNN